MLRARNISIATIAAATLLLSGCTSMLTGASGSSAGRPIGKDTRSQSTISRDAAISKRIRARFAADAELSGAGVIVQTSNGIVTLSGDVRSYDNRDRAVRLARDTADVSRVYNRIVVRSR